MIKNQVKTLEDLVEEYKERKVNYSTYEFDDLSYRTLILDIHTMLKETQKYKEVIEKVIDYINDVSRHTDNYFDLDNNLWIREVEILDILKEVEHEKIND